MARNFFENIEYNKILLESDNFIVIPSLGSLVEGWLLIIPKVFQINFSQLDSSELQEVTALIKRLEAEILPSFGINYVLFEHGPTSFLSKTGCGVDYAHLHFVPCEFDLIKGVDNFLNLQYDWQKLKDITEVSHFKDSNLDYLLLKDQNGDFYITFQNDIQSQTFRKVIANYLNIPEKFDWNMDFNKENIDSTIAKIKPVLA